MSTIINTAILKLKRRSEKYTEDQLVKTFVDVGSLFTLLMNEDHQILYGRRGTGKTHVLAYLCSKIKENGNCPIYIDLRLIGSTGGLYSDETIPFSERATRLLIDVFTYIHDQILEFVAENQDDDIHFGKIGPLLEDLAKAISEIQISGEVTEEILVETNDTESNDSGLTISKNPSLKIQDNISKSIKSGEKHLKTGLENHRIHFPSIRGVMNNILKALNPREIWIVLDEWAEIPMNLQPFLGDLLRRCLLPIYGITVKIGAIEHRSNFKISKNLSEYIGLETGADMSSINLDEFMVFDNNEYLSMDFFKNLLFKHINPLLDDKDKFKFSDELISAMFTQSHVFEEFVRSSEGVPRDAINILIEAATKAASSKISMKNIREAARSWYNRDKEKAVSQRSDAIRLLRWIIDEVIGKRNARAFLLKTDIENELIDHLYDSRVIHIIKQSVSGQDTPGIRYNVYSIDYGCYVDLKNTTKEPKGLFEVTTDDGEDKFVTVPCNDYRAIRRAILDLGKFYVQNETVE